MVSRVQELSSTLHDTNQNLREVDKLLDEYRYLSENYTQNMHQVRSLQLCGAIYVVASRPVLDQSQPQVCLANVPLMILDHLQTPFRTME